MSTESPVRKAKHLPGLIQPVNYLTTLWTHLTESLCQEVFEMTRDKERQRVWNLFILVQSYDTLRMVQAEIARMVDVERERLSLEKLFPRILENRVKLTWAEEGAEKYYWTVKAQYPEAPPDLHLESLRAFKLSLQGITLEKRNGHRRKWRFCKGRRQFISYSKIPGAKKHVQN